jgi:hypothetical protein
MKKLIPIFILIFILAIPSKGQTPDTLKVGKKYLIGNNTPVETQFILGPELKIAQLLDGTGIYTGFKGAIVINHKFAVGLTGGGFVKDPEFQGPNTSGEMTSLNIINGYGGLYLDYFLPSKSPIHISFPTTFGLGIIAITQDNQTASSLKDMEIVESDEYYVFEPSINADIYITKFLALGIGGGYRVAFHEKVDRLTASDLSGFSLNISIKVGSF